MPKFSRRTNAVFAFVAIVAIGYGVVLYWQYQNNVPQAFINARSQSAIIAQNIVDTSRQSTATLQEVNQEDLKGDDKDALALVTSMVSKSEDMRNQAVQLSNQIEQMTQSLSDIGSLDARQSALDAISSNLALINQLVNYSGDLGNLLDDLQSRFSGNGTVTNQQIQVLVTQINTDVTAINNFNNQATQAMQQFDTIEKGK
jgi:translation initiation factor 1 (eIF-1/SUI1)